MRVHVCGGGSGEWRGARGERHEVIRAGGGLSLAPPGERVAVLLPCGSEAALVLAPGHEAGWTADGREVVARLALLHDRSVVRWGEARLVVEIARESAPVSGPCGVDGQPAVARCPEGHLLCPGCVESGGGACVLCGKQLAADGGDEWDPEELFGAAPRREVPA